MKASPSINDGLEFQTQALLLRSQRQRLIASNIANADTPGYVARDMNFASALQAATGFTASSSGAVTATKPTVTQAGHLSVASTSDLDPTLNYATPAQTNLDGNTVDMDRERASFVDNAVKYEATLRFITSGVRTMLDAMKGPNQA